MSVRHFRRAKKVNQTPEGVGDIILSNNTIDPNAAQNEAVGVLSVFNDDAAPFSWVLNNTDFELSSASGSSTTLERSATGTLTAGGTESVTVSVTDSEARVVQKVFTINVDTVPTAIAWEVAPTIPTDITSGAFVGQIQVTGGRTPHTYVNSPANTDFVVSTSGVVTRSATGTLVEGSETLSIDVTDDNGNLYEANLSVTVDDAAEPPTDFATPDAPFGDAIVVLTAGSGTWPATVHASTTAAGFTPEETFASYNALITRINSLGGEIQVQFPSGFTASDFGAITKSLAFVWPTTTGAYGEVIPSGVVETGVTGGTSNPFSLSNTFTDPNGHVHIEGVYTRPRLTLIQCDQSYGFNSGGTYELQVGDRLTPPTGGAAATVKRIDLESGSWAGGDAAGRLVLHDWTGINFSTSSGNGNLNVGANTNVLTLLSGTPNFGPRAQRGITAFSHQSYGKLTIVGCKASHFTGNGITSEGAKQSINGETASMDIYDSEVSYCASVDTEHNLYCHNMTRLRMARFVSKDTSGGHCIKSESYRTEIVDSAAIRDSGSLEGISSHDVVNTSGTVAISINGVLTSGGVFTTTDELDLIRITYDGDCSGRYVTVTGTNFSDAVISEIIVGGNDRPRWSQQRFKTVTGATLHIVPSTTVRVGTKVYIGTGIANPSNQTATMNMSRVQDRRAANVYVQQRSITDTGGIIWDSVARSGKHGGYSPNKTPIVVNWDIPGTDKMPFESDGYTGVTTQINFGGVINGTLPATTTSLAVTGIRRLLSFSQNGTISLGVNYDVYIRRADETILHVVVQPTVVGTATATFPLLDVVNNPSGQLGGGGISGRTPIYIKRTTDVHDALDLNPRWFNANVDNNDNYFWSKTGARGVRASDGTLDRSKQSRYETGYYHDIMFSYDGKAIRSCFRSEPIGPNGYFSGSQPNPQWPWPPCNHPAGLWDDLPNAGTYEHPLEAAFPLTGTNPVGYVSRDNMGPNCDFVWPWPDYFKNFTQYSSVRVVPGNFDQFAGFADGTDDHPWTDRPTPDMRFVDSLGTLVKVTAANVNPAPVSSNALTVGTHAASATKLYVSTTSGITAGERLHVQLLPHRPGIDQLHATNVVSVGSDGGGPFINMEDALSRPIAARCEVASITAAGPDPDAYWITRAQYETL